ncbi:MAG: ABC transporter permease [Alphaproteobacteria bacterium]|nr:ABC transporter permease [Alphaproteobacteria bacterium]
MTSERFELTASETGAVLTLSGAWDIDSGVALADSVFRDGGALPKGAALAIDASAVERWDSALVVFMVDLRRRCDAAGVELDLSGLAPGARRLVDLALAVPAREGAARDSDEIPGFLERTGRDAIDAWKSGGEMVEFLGQSIISFGRTLRGTARYRMSDVILTFQQCGPDALPIVTLISFLVGVILGFVGLVQLEQFGASIFVANLVSVAMVRELGGMMTAIIMAGRTGAAFAAQIGTMNVNQETAAFKVIGIDPVEYLVLPRILALIVAVPMLTIYANIVGMLGGSVLATTLSDLTFTQYYAQTVGSVDLVDWASGLFKAAIYGVIIAIAGCLRGIQCGSNAAAVGNAATSAVVTSIVFIIIAQAILTVMYHILGI